MKLTFALLFSILALGAVYYSYTQYNTQEVADFECGLTSHFLDWANKNGRF